jgi:hypothetical protein
VSPGRMRETREFPAQTSRYGHTARSELCAISQGQSRALHDMVPGWPTMAMALVAIMRIKINAAKAHSGSPGGIDVIGTGRTAASGGYRSRPPRDAIHQERTVRGLRGLDCASGACAAATRPSAKMATALPHQH